MSVIVGWNWIWALDGWIVAVAMLCAVASASLGNFLVLRRMSMLGDAITHAVLPGLAVAFFISHSRSSLPMFLGAVIVGILTAFFTEWIRRVGKVDEGASMGVVFTSLFALGLVMIVQAADKVDLDAGCVLYGAIELTPLDTISLLGSPLPRAFLTLGVVTVVNLLFVVLFYKELKLSSFDPALATTTGFQRKFDALPVDGTGSGHCRCQFRECRQRLGGGDVYCSAGNGVHADRPSARDDRPEFGGGDLFGGAWASGRDGRSWVVRLPEHDDGGDDGGGGWWIAATGSPVWSESWHSC